MKTKPSKLGIGYGEPVVKLEQDGFSVHIAVIRDEVQDTSYFGEFSDTPNAEAFDRVKAGLHDERGRNSGYRYFNPILRKETGATRHGQRRDWKRMEAWLRDEWTMCGVVVKAYRNGIELGHASLWGIESDAGDYFDEVAEELIPEALDDARKAIAGLTVVPPITVE